MRRMADLFDQLAKGLGRHMHTGKQLVTGSLPAIGTALEYVHLVIPQRVKALGRTCGNIAAVLVIDHQPHLRIGRQSPNLQLQSAVR
ncbi:hypothetical protein D3C85_1769080 [compost metagenome]